ncbi:MAG: hypothetical protein PHF79_01690 [Candidatus Pacebacteria bacterium]|nr:hypothetical protein [Candidatus Paceibacterota bacterium]
MNFEKHTNLKYKIAVSGAAEMGFLGPEAYEVAKEVGRQVVKHQAFLITGATTGFPLWAAMGAKEEKGTVVGLSPAENEREHLDVYRLPIDYTDFIIYTGFGYAGRDILFTRTADAVIIGAGRIGTIHEFTISYEDQKPMGILQSDYWETDEVIKFIMDKSHRTNPKVIFDKDPAKLVERLIKMIEEDKKKNYTYKNDDGIGGKGERIL